MGKYLKTAISHIYLGLGCGPHMLIVLALTVVVIASIIVGGIDSAHLHANDQGMWSSYAFAVMVSLLGATNISLWTLFAFQVCDTTHAEGLDRE